MSEIDKLKELSKDAHLLSAIYFLLEWDQETYLPKGSIDLRAMQKELMASLIHEKHTNEAFKTALSSIIDLQSGNFLSTLSDEEKAMAREWRRDFLLSSKLPQEFVKEFAKTTSISTNAWAKAKKEDDFKQFCPHLEKNIDLIRRRAEYLGYKDHPYDALIDENEPDMTTKELKELFDGLKPFLVSLLEEIKSKPIPQEDFLHDNFNFSDLFEFCQTLLQEMHVDPAYSRLDIAPHPFCISDHPQDVRLTTYNDTEHLMGMIGATIHEGGHALYQLGLPKKHYGNPLCEPISFGIHESQSRWWETIIGQSLPFWRFFYPKLQKKFSSKLSSVSLEQFYAAINLVKPSLIRVYADEVTYCLHIILRFELELELMENTLQASQIPEAWNAKMEKYLGIKPKTDREGCLQDIHWSAGLFGYFPTYAIGNLYASQFSHSLQKQHPEWEREVSNGNLSILRNWQLKEIHSKGKYYPAHELIKKISGESLSSKYYIDYLKSKYSDLYKLV